ncbi:hypothetical protein [Shewanella hanedai]|uniref:hypothetical protein n=1 Tax=Shewanella hanedai TaxID=25 RepID=UPI00163D51B7|nr:hypothetical protein [Shewanella hanedai]
MNTTYSISLAVKHNMLRIKLQTNDENIDLDHDIAQVGEEQNISASEATDLIFAP